MGGIEWPFLYEGRLTLSLDGMAGRFDRAADPASAVNVGSLATSVGVGAHVSVAGPFFARLSWRWTKAWDDDYQQLMGEALDYRMVGLTVGVEVDFTNTGSR